jgi:HD-GYP domain-containing protein (c-di-GMP phosphodiesterase class II)
MPTAISENPACDESRSHEFHAIATSSLRVGARLRVPIYDGDDVLLIARGQVITPVFLEKLRLRRIETVKVHQSELPRVFAGTPQGDARHAPNEHGGVFAPHENAASVALDTLLKKGGHLGLPPQGEALAGSIVRHGASEYADGALEKFVDRREQSLDQVQDVYRALSEGRGLNTDALNDIAEEAMVDITEDFDLFNCLGVNPHTDRYPVRHSLHVSMLAMGIGTKLGLDRTTLKELSMGCLVHDAGMLKVDEDLYTTPAPLNRVEFLEITKHPVIVFDMMNKMERISSRAAFVAYQVHERCNGQGYPRRRHGQQIHFLSKLASIADAYIALVSPRPHRSGMLPYKAIERVLSGVKDGLYDPLAMRALLQTVGLFPIGSFVELSDDRVGKVIRANGEVYHRPILSVWRKGATHELPDVVDLKEETHLAIQRPLPNLEEFAPKVDGAEYSWE